MDVYDPIARQHLFKAVESSYRNLEPFRNLNRALIEEYAGSGYGHQSKARQEILVNLMNQTVDAYTMALVANRPRIMVSTHQQAFCYFAKQFEIAVNNLIEEIGLESTLRQWVLDAFFCLGVIKIHLAEAGEVQLETDMRMDPGRPFASNVSLDNFVFDSGATRWEQVKFAGDRYRITYEELNSGLFDPEAIKDIQPTSKYSIESERVEMFSRGQAVDPDEVEPMIDLADIWIPKDGKIYTFVVDKVSEFRLKGDPIAVMDWNGPEFGPYHLLAFNDVPENIMPTSPASHLSGLSRLINNIARKQGRRAKSAKRMHTYTPASKDGANRLRKEGDDAWVEVEDVNDIGAVEVGGIDPTAQQFLLGIMEMYDRMAGNLTAMMGLGAQADTVGQEQLIHSAVSNKEASMQYRVVNGSVRVVRDLAHLLWNDKFKVIQGQLPIDGAEGYFVDVTWTPEDREGDFMDYNFNIDLFSMPYQSPAQKVQALNQLITQIYAPLAQVMMSQGGQINLQKLTEIYADMLNLPRLKEVIQFASGADDYPPPSGSEGAPKSPVSTRNYVRRNVPTGGTVQSRSQVQQQMWANTGQANQQQRASMTMPPAA